MNVHRCINDQFPNLVLCHDTPFLGVLGVLCERNKEMNSEAPAKSELPYYDAPYLGVLGVLCESNKEKISEKPSKSELPYYDAPYLSVLGVLCEKNKEMNSETPAKSELPYYDAPFLAVLRESSEEWTNVDLAKHAKNTKKLHKLPGHPCERRTVSGFIHAVCSRCG